MYRKGHEYKMNDGFEIDFSELTESLTKAARKYPDKAESRLRTVSNRFRRDVINDTKSQVKEHTGNLIKGMKLDRIRGYGANIERDFRGTSPHFHLIENGHEIVTAKTKNGKQIKNGGKKIGFVEGKHIVKKKREQYAEYVMPFEMKRLLDEITKECGLDD